MPWLWSLDGAQEQAGLVYGPGRLFSVHPQCGQGLGWQGPASTLL